jgi:hypothetical protein
MVYVLSKSSYEFRYTILSEADHPAVTFQSIREPKSPATHSKTLLNRLIQ